MSAGLTEEAVNAITHAIELDLLSLAVRWNAGVFCYLARKYDRAVAESRKCFEFDPAFVQAWSTLVFVLAKQGHDDGLIAQFERIAQLSAGNQYLLGILGHYYASVGRRSDAQGVLDQLRAVSAQRWVSAFWPAVIKAGLGEMEEAFCGLDAAYVEHTPWLTYAKVAPFLDDLRSDARFDELLRRLNPRTLVQTAVAARGPRGAGIHSA